MLIAKDAPRSSLINTGKWALRHYWGTGIVVAALILLGATGLNSRVLEMGENAAVNVVQTVPDVETYKATHKDTGGRALVGHVSSLYDQFLSMVTRRATDLGTEVGKVTGKVLDSSMEGIREGMIKTPGAATGNPATGKARPFILEGEPAADAMKSAGLQPKATPTPQYRGLRPDDPTNEGGDGNINPLPPGPLRRPTLDQKPTPTPTPKIVGRGLRP